MKISNFKFQILNSKKGFTLIELLVVIAIIGVLSALLMSNFVGIRQRARDGQRKSDLRQLQSAFELYRADAGQYPTSFASTIACDPTAQLLSGTTVYMKSIPCDPLGTSPYVYQYVGDSSSYCLQACLENGNDSQKDATNNDVDGCGFDIDCTDGAVSYTLQNP